MTVVVSGVKSRTVNDLLHSVRPGGEVSPVGTTVSLSILAVRQLIPGELQMEASRGEPTPLTPLGSEGIVSFLPSTGGREVPRTHFALVTGLRVTPFRGLGIVSLLSLSQRVKVILTMVSILLLVPVTGPVDCLLGFMIAVLSGVSGLALALPIG